MSEWAWKVLEINIQAAVLIPGVLLMQKLCEKHVSPRLRYGLWLAPMMRLLLPVTIVGAFSMMSILQPYIPARQPAAQQEQQTPSGQPVHPFLLDEAYLPEYPLAIGPQPQAAHTPEIEPLPAQAAGGKAGWGPMALCIWAAGAACVLACAAAGNARFYRRHVKGAKKLERACKLPVYRSDSLASPCLYGLFRPRVLLNAAALRKEATAELALAHELAHYRQRDHWFALLRIIVCAVYWYNPLVWLAAVKSKRDCELSCDAMVIKGFTQQQCEAYGMALLDIIQSGSKGGLACATTMAGSKRGLKKRIALIGGRPQARASAAVAACLAICVLFAFACTSAPGREEPRSPAFRVSVKESGRSIPLLERAHAQTDAEINEMFVEYLTEAPYVKMPVVPFGYTISIRDLVGEAFAEQHGELAICVNEYIANREDGCIKFRASADAPGSPVPLHVISDEKGTTYEFPVEPNSVALFSSHLEDYEPGATLRAFVITLSWEEDGVSIEKDYCFMLRTDAYAPEARGAA